MYIVKEKPEAVLQWIYIPDFFPPTFYCGYWIRFFPERQWGTTMKCQHSVKCEVAQQSQRCILLGAKHSTDTPGFQHRPCTNAAELLSSWGVLEEPAAGIHLQHGLLGIPVCLFLSCKLHSVVCFTSAWQYTAWTRDINHSVKPVL